MTPQDIIEGLKAALLLQVHRKGTVTHEELLEVLQKILYYAEKSARIKK